MTALHCKVLHYIVQVTAEGGALTLGASVCIGSEGDMHNVSTAKCAIRMAMAGAHVCINRINASIF